MCSATRYYNILYSILLFMHNISHVFKWQSAVLESVCKNMHLKYTDCTWYLLISISSVENLIPICRAVGFKWAFGWIYLTISWVSFQILWLSRRQITMRKTPHGVLEIILCVMVHTYLSVSLKWMNLTEPTTSYILQTQWQFSWNMFVLYLFWFV